MIIIIQYNAGELMTLAHNQIVMIFLSVVVFAEVACPLSISTNQQVLCFMLPASCNDDISGCMLLPTFNHIVINFSKYKAFRPLLMKMIAGIFTRKLSEKSASVTQFNTPCLFTHTLILDHPYNRQSTHTIYDSFSQIWFPGKVKVCVNYLL